MFCSPVFVIDCGSSAITWVDSDLVTLFYVKVQIGIIFFVIQYIVCIGLFRLVILVPWVIQVYQAFRLHDSYWIRNIVQTCPTCYL